jgi:hypothetical protein
MVLSALNVALLFYQHKLPGVISAIVGKKQEHYNSSCEVSATSVVEQSENQGEFSTHI